MNLRSCTVKDNGEVEIVLVFSSQEMERYTGISPNLHLANITRLISERIEKWVKEGVLS